MDTVGVILAGGASRRMGRPKASIRLAGRTLAEWVGSALAGAVDELISSGAETIPGVEAIPDGGPPHRGPLSGLAAAAAARPDAQLVVVAVDQPWVRAETVRRLAGTGSKLPVIPVDGGIRQVLCARYPPGLASLAAGELEGGGSIQSLLDVTSFQAVTGWSDWGEDGRSWYSVDTPESIAEGLARFGPPGGPGGQPPM